jgi:hypothetical protein
MYCLFNGIRNLIFRVHWTDHKPPSVQHISRTLGDVQLDGANASAEEADEG